MPQDRTTAGYKVSVIFEFTEVNKYGDKIGDGHLAMTKVIHVKSLAELGTVLARVDEMLLRRES